MVAFGKIIYQKLLSHQLFGREFCVVQLETLYVHQDDKQVNFVQKTVSFYRWLVYPRREVHNFLTTGPALEPFNQNLTNFTFFSQHLQPLYDVKQKETENLELVPGVNFEFIDSLKESGTKYLFTFNNSCEEICSLKVFVDFATATGHLGMSTIYIKHNLFHQSKLGRDDELQHQHIVLYKSRCDVMQVSTLIAQLGLKSDLVDCRNVCTLRLFVD